MMKYSWLVFQQIRRCRVLKIFHLSFRLMMTMRHVRVMMGNSSMEGCVVCNLLLDRPSTLCFQQEMMDKERRGGEEEAGAAGTGDVS